LWAWWLWSIKEAARIMAAMATGLTRIALAHRQQQPHQALEQL
jgi:hypothetical protein